MNLMDDEIYDPDLEARLYAEIYYSNDTYPDTGPQNPPGSPKNPENSLWRIDPQPGGSEKPESSRRPFPKRYRALLDGIPTQTPFPTPRTRNETPRNSDRERKTDNRPSNRRRGILRSPTTPEPPRPSTRPRLLLEEDEEPDRTSLTTLAETLTSPSSSRLESTDSPASPSPQKPENPSKYEVSPKKVDKIKEFEAACDSDDSIFEVPVPPKPAPPLISLKDSDEESSEEELVVVDDSEDLGRKSSSPSIILDDSDSRDSPTLDVGTEDLIINCTSVQKGARSLEEIRRMRESDKETISRQSDEESMTESEAMNWRSLEGKISRNKEYNPSEERIDLWNDLSNDSEASEKEILEEGELVDSENEAISPKNKRIRENGGEEVREDEPAPKKKKQKEMSFQEYMFQPMPKQMVAFYNNPRGGEMMKDIKDIQNKMPKNPNCWAILDDDMYPPSRRRTVCAVCQSPEHGCRKCPHKSKPPICHICGFNGHTEPRCPYNKQCINCGKKYGTCRKTCETCNSLRCSQCSGKGHTMASCPDNWRKYHQTVSGTEPKIPKHSDSILKPWDQLSCCNCTRRGHDAATCINYRWSAHFIQKCYIKDYNIGPNYRSSLSPQEYPRINDKREEIDVGRLGIDVNGPGSYLYRFVNFKPTNADGWKEYSIIPNKLPGVDYPVSSATPIHPKFLQLQFHNRKCCPMEVIVRRSFEQNGLPEIIIKTPDTDSLERLKVLILQWLIRSKADKDTHKHAEPLPHYRAQLLKVLEAKKDAFIKRQITSIDPNELETCRSLEKSLMSKHVYGKRRKQFKEEEKKNLRKLRQLKTKFVVAAYKIMLIGTVMDTFSCFMEFMEQLEQLNRNDVPGILYMTAVWYNFELFVPHTSPAVVDAIKRWQNSPDLRQKGLELFQSKYGGNEGILKIQDTPIPSLLSLDPNVLKDQNPIQDVETSIPSLLSLNLSDPGLINQDKSFEKQLSEKSSENNYNIQIINQLKLVNSTVDMNSIPSSSGPSGKNKRKSLNLEEKLSRSQLKRERKVQEIAEANGTALGLVKINDVKGSKRAQAGKIMRMDRKLDIPNGMPIPHDPRVYNKIILRKQTQEAVKFIEEHRIEKARLKMEEFMSNSKNRIVTKQNLIDIWTMIRAAMKHKKKIQRFGKRKS